MLAEAEGAVLYNRRNVRTSALQCVVVVQLLRGPSLVLATSINACAAQGRAVLRTAARWSAATPAGYTPGTHHDHYGHRLAELRGHTNGRFAVRYSAASTSRSRVSDIFSAKVLPARTGPSSPAHWYNTHMRLGAARGYDGGLLYFSVGEAF
jgi:hypothetical protein